MFLKVLVIVFLLFLSASAFCILAYDEYVQDRRVKTVPLLQMCEARFYETIQVCSETSKDFQLVP